MVQTLPLPAHLRRRLEAEYQALIQPKDGPVIDFSQPPGAAALTAPDSVSWRVFKNPISLYIGGVAAVILELAEPRVRAGVWDHSQFRTDPVTRLRRTGLAAMVSIYGDQTTALAMIARVNRAHQAVSGTADNGQAYRASEVELLDWVQATASFGFMQAYHQFVRPLSPAEQDAVFAEARPVGEAYGARNTPLSVTDWEHQLETMLPKLDPSPILDEFFAIMREAKALPSLARPLLQPLLIRAAVEITPPKARALLGLTRDRGLKPWQAHVVRLIGQTADRLPVHNSPAVQSCLRMGLPEDYLYRT